MFGKHYHQVSLEPVGWIFLETFVDAVYIRSGVCEYIWSQIGPLCVSVLINTMNISIFIPFPEIILSYRYLVWSMHGPDSSFWLANNRELYNYTHVSHVWRHQREIWWEMNVIDDVTMASRPPSAFLAAVMRSSNIVFIRWFRPDKRGSWDFKTVCFRGYGNLSTLSIAIPHLNFVRARYCDAVCG